MFVIKFVNVIRNGHPQSAYVLRTSAGDGVIEADFHIVFNKGRATLFREDDTVSRFIFENSEMLCKYYGAEKVVKELV